MESGRKLDAFGSTLLSVVLCLAVASQALFAAADPYEHGMELARLGRWDEARAVLLAGHRQSPGDPRFPVELGGVAFKRKRYGEAAGWLRRALRMNPGDAYAADFLATIYFLQGNTEAALKYWNRIDKPRIGNLRIEPGLRVDPVLLDRALFAPAGTLRLPEFIASGERIGALGIFPAYAIRLEAREDGAFDAAFNARERNGWGSGREALLSTLRGLFYQAIHPEYFNLARSGVNIESMLRWDPEKRRVRSVLSGPWKGNPAYRYSLGVDLRDENWDLRSASPGALGLRKSAAGGTFSSFRGNWFWSTGAELSHRAYRDVAGGPQDVLLAGYQLKHTLEVRRGLWRSPERRIESTLSLASDAGRIWSGPSHTFERLQISSISRWLPRMTGDDYAVEQHIRAGRIFGRAPFDELFMLGLERDNDLRLRAHIGTRDGRKGSAPLSRQYLLGNWEIDKNVYNDGLIGVKLSPFLDVCRYPGAGKWLWDTGVQAKFRVLGVRLAFTYGKDLRTGKNAFYLTGGR